MTTRFPEKLAEMHDLPKEFGEDGGHFFKYYDDLAEESDEDLVQNLKAQLDGILIFAGLFAGVNTAFLAFTLPQMSADPADDTNALLLQIAVGGNGSITSAADLPSASFTPQPGIYPINVLFSVSLTLALLSSFLAVLGQQWIVYYRKRSSGGSEDRRWEQLRRYLGAKRWRLELVLDDVVPSLLQLGLVIFCIAFALYLGTLSQSLNRIITSLLSVAAAAILVMATGSAFDPWCPFKQPLSRITRSAASVILAVVPWLVIWGVTIVAYLGGHIFRAIWRAQLFYRSPNIENPQHVQIYRIVPPLEAVKILIRQSTDIYWWFMFAGIRTAEDPGELKIEALRRVICTSENRKALIYAAINLRVIRDERALSSLGKDVGFCTRLSSLQQAALRETQHGRTGSHYSSIESRLFSTSFFHVLFSTSSTADFVYGGDPLKASESLWIPLDQLRHLHEGSVIAVEKSCDQCFHCAPLLFSVRVVFIIAQSAGDCSQPNLDTAFKSIAGVSTGTHDLRLGFMVASAMLFPKQTAAAEWADVSNWTHARFLRALFAAYRETSERVMFQTMSIALTTVSAERTGRPDYEIYVWLFELCLLPGRNEIYAVDQHAVLEHVDDHLLSIENRIRDENASETDRQHGRDYQIRYVQSMVDFFGNHQDSSEEMWTLIGAPLERYIRSVKVLTEADPRHSENLRTMDVLRHIEASFPEPQLVEVSAPNTGDEQEQEQNPQYVAYLKCRQLLDDIGLNFPVEGRAPMRENAMQFARGCDGGERVRLSEIAHHLWGN